MAGYLTSSVGTDLTGSTDLPTASTVLTIDLQVHASAGAVGQSGLTAQFTLRGHTYLTRSTRVVAFATVGTVGNEVHTLGTALSEATQAANLAFSTGAYLP